MHTANGNTASSVQRCQSSDTSAPRLAPGLTLQNLYGCTININNNCNQISNPASQSSLTEVDIVSGALDG